MLTFRFATQRAVVSGVEQGKRVSLPKRLYGAHRLC
jgi:hypothetical protein